MWTIWEASLFPKRFILKLQIFKFILEIQISRYNKGGNDWELDGDIHVDLDK